VDAHRQVRSSLADADIRAADFWVRRLRDLPDVRWTKVEAARRACARGTYDDGPFLDAALESLGNEVGVLCRQEHFGSSA